jgi:hypothetical protein
VFASRRNGRSGVRLTTQRIPSLLDQFLLVAQRAILALELGLPRPQIAQSLPEHHNGAGQHQQRSKHLGEWYRSREAATSLPAEARFAGRTSGAALQATVTSKT